MILNNYWIILVLITLFKVKDLSSYNVKWLILYTAYVVWLQAEGDFDFTNYGDYEIYIWIVFLIPLALYILFPTVYRHIKDWKAIRWCDRVIDTLYQRIKELSQKEKGKED